MIWSVFKNTRNITLFILSICIAFLSGFVPIDDEFSFQRALSFFPFFVAGVIFKRQNLVDKLERIPLSYSVIVLLIGLVVARLIPQYYMPHLHYADWNDPLTRIVQSSIAFALCFSIIRLSRTEQIEPLAKFGKYTLWVFIGHTFLVRENFLENLLYDNFGYELKILGALLVCLIYCFLFIGLAKIYFWLKVCFLHQHHPFE